MINLQDLAARLTEKGLIDKAFYDMNRDEVLTLCDAVLSAHTPENEIIPYISYAYIDPVLVVPSNSSPLFRRIGLIGKDACIVLKNTLTMLGADYEMMRRYLGDEWNA